MPTITRAGATIADDVAGPNDEATTVVLDHGTTRHRLARDIRLPHARVTG